MNISLLTIQIFDVGENVYLTGVKRGNVQCLRTQKRLIHYSFPGHSLLYTYETDGRKHQHIRLYKYLKTSTLTFEMKKTTHICVK